MIKSKWLLGLLIVVLTIIIGFAFYYIIDYGLYFTFDDIKDFLGIIISCTSMLITAYFVVMAVSAYSHIKKIEEIRNRADELDKLINDYNNMANDTFDIMLSLTDNIIMQADSIKGKIQRENFVKLIYRFGAYKYPQYHDEETRHSYLLNLGNVGDQSDIIPLEKIRSDSNESPRIREASKYAIEEIGKRVTDKAAKMKRTKRYTWLQSLLKKIMR